MNDLFLGIDIGTSSLKAIACDGTGHIVAQATRPYGSCSAADGGMEQDPSDWERALLDVLGELPRTVRERIAGIGVDGHVPSLLPLDADGRPVGPCLTWQDNRASAEAAHLAALIGDPLPHIGTNLPWAPSQLPAKAAWLAGRDPETASRTAYLVQPKDYLNALLTGRIATDAWSSKGIVDVARSAAASPIMAAAGWTDAVVPEVCVPWEKLGEVTREAAARFGLRAGTPVAAGWSDAMASILACGAFDAPTAVVLTGTSEIVGMSAATVEPVEGLYIVPPGVAPLALSYGPTQTSGAALLWIAETVGIDPGAALDLAAAAQTAPTFVPYIDGERAPIWRPEVRGLFLGVDRRHGAGELTRAVLEGVALSARHVLTAASRATGSALTDVSIGGRGVDHPAWLHARARALGVPLRLHAHSHLTALGAAMLGARAAGAGAADLEAMRGTVIRYAPTPDERAAGDRAFDNYLRAAQIATDWSLQ